MARSRKLLHVFSITVDIPLQLGKSQIMRFKREEPETPVC